MLAALSKQLRRITLSQELVAGAFILIFALFAVLSVYSYAKIATLSSQVSRINTELAINSARLQDTLAAATTSIDKALAEQNQNVEAQLGGVKDEVGHITGTVTDLQKLSKTDPELLSKYSKVFFLSENYAPARLIEIPSQYEYNEKNKLQIIPEVLPYLELMMDQAKADGIPLYLNSAYRSFNTQQSLKGQYTFTYGAGTANQFSADQGYSEHQLGTAVDFITTGTGGALAGFDRMPAYTWLQDHAYQYGFVLSYPKNNGYYIFEPWHWRFVGKKLATNLHATGSYFYTLDQRTIDDYLISLFDN